MIIAIDGPAGAGKSTTARAVAQRLGYGYIDSGAMYRAIALASSEKGVNPLTHPEKVTELAQGLALRFSDGGKSTFIDARDISQLIRTAEISTMASQVAAIPGVRHALVKQQQRLGKEAESTLGGAVLEGRDIQTVVFPDAEIKIFLTASTTTRAKRRHLEEEPHKNLQTTVQQIAQRDQRDSNRSVSPLEPAADAVILETDHLSLEEVVQKIVELVERK